MTDFAPWIDILLVVAGILTARAALITARTPQGASAWVVFLISFPLLALPAFALFGGVSRLSPNRDKRHSHIPTEPADGRLEQLVGVTGRPVTASNNVALLIDGKNTFDAIFHAIDAAEHDILIQFYIIRSDELGLALQDRLIAAAQRGVEVRLLCDNLGSLFLGHRYTRTLTDAGIRIKGIPGPHRALGRISLNFRNHRKTVIIDGTTGFTGGLNVGQEYIDGGRKFDRWRDTYLKLEGPMVTQLHDIFAKDWFNVTGERLPKLVETPTAGTVRGIMASSGPTDLLERGSMMLCGLANQAHRRLWIATPYLVPHTDLSTALQLASLRGVDVRILIPKPADHNLAWYASRNAAASLVKAGIKVMEYQPGFMHSKVILIDDDLASIGTINLDIRSALLNFEQTALLEDKTFAKQVETMMQEDFDQSTPLASPPSWHVRLLGPVAHLFGPLL